MQISHLAEIVYSSIPGFCNTANWTGLITPRTDLSLIEWVPGVVLVPGVGQERQERPLEHDRLADEDQAECTRRVVKTEFIRH